MPKRLPVREDMAQLRVVFTMVPWKMRPRVIALLAAAALSAVLDMVAVAAMLPLTQMLTMGGEMPGVVERYVVPLMGTSDRRVILAGMALLIGVLFLAKNVSMIVIRWFSIGVTQKACSAVQSALLKGYTSLSYEEHRRQSRSVTTQVIFDAAPRTFQGVLLGYIAIAVDALTVLLLFLTLVVLSPLGSIMAIVIFGGSALLVSRVLKPYAIRCGLRSLDLATASWGYINPAIEGFRETRIFQRESVFTDAYDENRERYARYQQRATMLGELPKYLLEIAMVFGIFVIALLLFATSSESTAFGLLAVFGAAAMRIVPTLNRLVATLNGVRGAKASLTLCAEQILKLQRVGRFQVAHSGDATPFPDGDIVVQDLDFSYQDSDRQILSDINVTIPQGSTVALVGSSGAGKTTFADLLVGLLEPSRGSISVDGRSIVEHPAQWLSTVAMVSQKVYLWDASLRDLITFSQPEDEVDQELLAEVVRKARLDEVVAQLPDGLETLIGDGGMQVSGGQAQRIGIARALYAQPRVLILDEATSALDNETEHQITQTIEALRGEITVVVIAHRLSTVKNADQILFFDQGTLVDQGTMAELRDRVPAFARLVELGTLNV